MRPIQDINKTIWNVKIVKNSYFSYFEAYSLQRGHISKRLKIELVQQFWPELAEIWFEGLLGSKF